jgi:hypothetical protein
MEIKMGDLKKFVMNEIQENLKRELGRKKIMESSKNLFEAVTLSENAKAKNDPSKIKLAETAIEVAEKKLKEDYDEYDNGCDCGEGEGEMLKAQLMSIMSNAKKLYHMIDSDDQFEDWLQSKITIAEDYIQAAYSYLTYYNAGEDGEVSEDDWDGEEFNGEEDWDEIEEEDWNDEMESIQPSMQAPNYMTALSPDVDDDEIFESKK